MNKISLPIILVTSYLLFTIAPAMAWYDNYSYRADVVNQSTVNLSMSINGTYGFNGRIIWYNATQGDAWLYYNDSNDFAVVNDNVSLGSYEVEGFYITNNVSNIYSQNASAIYHFGETSQYDYWWNGTRTVGGKIGAAQDFDESHYEYIAVGDIDALDMKLSDWSVSFWINYTGSTGVVVGKDVVPPPEYYHQGWFVYAPDGYVRGVFGNGTNHFIGTKDGQLINDSQWHHVVVTFDRDGNMTRYVDGNQTGTIDDISSWNNVNIDNTIAAQIGCRNTSRTQFFTGKLDDLRVYNKTLSPSEITELYNSGNGTQTENIAPDNLVWHVTFESGLDSSGNGNYFAKIPYAATKLVSGYTGRGIQFDGTNDYIDLKNSPSLNITDNLTISLWVKENGTQANWTRLVSKELSGVGLRQYILFYDNLTHIRALVDTVGTSSVYVTGSTLDNNWHHIAMTYGSNTLELFVDGVSQGTAAGSGDLVGVSSNISIGKKAWDYDNYFNGIIDEVRLYNKDLNASEIEYLYNLSKYNYLGEYESRQNEIVIDFPQPTTYCYNVTNLNYTFNVDVNETPNLCWYSIDGGVTNSTPISAGTDFTNVIDSGGRRTWTVFCNTTSGNETFASVTFTVPDNKTIYIDPSQPANGNGSYTNPYNTWQSVDWIPGGKYLWKRGTTEYSVFLKPNITGCSNYGITIGAYGEGSNPIWDGKKIFNGTGNDWSNNTALEFIGASYFKVENITFYNYTMSASTVWKNSHDIVFKNCQALRIERGYSYAGNTDPSHCFQVRNDDGFLMVNVTFENVTAKWCGGDAFTAGTYADNVTYTNCTANYTNYEYWGGAFYTGRNYYGTPVSNWDKIGNLTYVNCRAYNTDHACNGTDCPIHGDGFYADDYSSNIVYYNCIAKNTSRCGFRTHNGNNITIAYSISVDSKGLSAQYAGGFYNNGATNLTLSNCISYNDAEQSNMPLYNSIIVNGDLTAGDYNLFVNSGAPVGAHSFTGDVDFENPNNLDFHIHSGYSTIDKGTLISDVHNASWFDGDIDGDTITQVDLGVDEILCSDANSDGTVDDTITVDKSNLCKSIQNASLFADSNDKIFIKSGNYLENWSMAINREYILDNNAIINLGDGYSLFVHSNGYIYGNGMIITDRRVMEKNGRCAVSRIEYR